MTINYCDWLTGDDTTGNGSAALPYKTITKASTGLTGGDEVRVAKSTDPAMLTGTISATDGSTAITGVGTAFLTELAVADFIEIGTDTWWEVTAIASDTSCTLQTAYAGPSVSGYTSRRLTATSGITDTGSATSSTTTVQQVISAISGPARLKISGGWNLATQLQDGTTRFRQKNTTITNRYGYGLYLNTKKYIEVSNLSFLRYNLGVYLYNGASFNIINIEHVLGCSIGVQVYTNCTDDQITVQKAIGNTSYGIYLYTGSNACVAECGFSSGGNSGMAIYGSANCELTLTQAAQHTSFGVNIMYSKHNRVNVGSCRNTGAAVNLITYSSDNVCTVGTSLNDSYGAFRCASPFVNYLHVDQVSGGSYGAFCDTGAVMHLYDSVVLNTNEFSVGDNTSGARVCSHNHDGISNNDWVFLNSGTFNKQSAITQSGSGFAWRASVPSVQGYASPMILPVMQVACAGGSEVTVSAWVKKDHATNVAAQIRIRGGILPGVTDDVIALAANSTDWQQLRLTFTPTEDCVVPVVFETWYIAGASFTYIDSLEVSQS